MVPKLDLTIMVLGALGLALTTAFSMRILNKVDSLRNKGSQ